MSFGKYNVNSTKFQWSSSNDLLIAHIFVWCLTMMTFVLNQFQAIIGAVRSGRWMSVCVWCRGEGGRSEQRSALYNSWNFYDLKVYGSCPYWSLMWECLSLRHCDAPLILGENVCRSYSECLYPFCPPKLLFLALLKRLHVSDSSASVYTWLPMRQFFFKLGLQTSLFFFHFLLLCLTVASTVNADG